MKDSWIKITEETEFPNKEVLACNMKLGSYGYMESMIGYVNQDSDNGKLYLSNENTLLYDITHFQEIELPEA